LDYNAHRMPFAAAQIGTAFRNEISPRAGLLRVREFTMAEIEHFVNPSDKSHSKFKDVANIVLSLLPREAQTGEDISRPISVGDAVAQGIIGNETLAYFVARTHLFLLAVGIKPEKLRFRQHKWTEMAHYAKDCWDAEVHTTYGWVEVVGHADRAAFDLAAHSHESKHQLEAYEVWTPPREVEEGQIQINKGLVGKTFRNSAKQLLTYLEGLQTNTSAVIELGKQLAEGNAKLTLNGVDYPLTKEMLTTSVGKVLKHGAPYIPNVIEPSFGIGRIMYAIFEHNYVVRQKEKKEGKEQEKKEEKQEERAYLALPTIIAPIKVAILPMSSQDAFQPVVQQLVRGFLALNLAAKVDDSTAGLGRKYARADEIGIPFAVTLDFDTLKDKSVTLRERDSMLQIRVTMDQAFLVISQFVAKTLTWARAYETFPRVFRPETDDES